MPAWRLESNGLVLTVRLTPRAGRDALGKVEKLVDGRKILSARVRAAPTEGEANAALVRLLARTLRHPASQIEFVRGATSRIKTLLLAGAGADVEERLRHVLAGE